MAIGQAGQPYSKVALLQQEPQQLMHTFALVADAVRGCRLVTISPQAIQLQRRFVPIWGFLIPIVGIAMVAIEATGGQAKLVETLTIALDSEPGATRVSAAGVANPELAERLDELLESTSS